MEIVMDSNVTGRLAPLTGLLVGIGSTPEYEFHDPLERNSWEVTYDRCDHQLAVPMAVFGSHHVINLVLAGEPMGVYLRAKRTRDGATVMVAVEIKQ